jgi:two-component system chemotaxis response regulator CheB
MGPAYSPQEIEQIFALAEKSTGSSQKGRFRKDVLIGNVHRRQQQRGCENLSQYLALVESDVNEKSYLLSALTIHTTSWFREPPHYEYLKRIALKHALDGVATPFRFWSAASSTGEELYSAGIVLESIRERHRSFEYQLVATDIDPVSVATGQRGTYREVALENIPEEYRNQLWLGSGPTQGWFTVSPEIRKRARFFSLNLKSIPAEFREFDSIFCRNVLIYFEEKSGRQIVNELASRLSQSGTLVLGHCEVNLAPTGNFRSVQSSCYQRTKNDLAERLSGKTRTILVVDDSSTVRKCISRILINAGYLVTEADSAHTAGQRLAETQFHLITLDLNMPGESGVQFLKKMRKSGLKTPIMIVSDSSAKDADSLFGALESGAQDYVVKSIFANGSDEFVERVNNLVKTGTEDSAESNEDSPWLQESKNLISPEAILVGASTGGPEALTRVLKDLGRQPQVPPVLVVQHIHSIFARPFAERLAQSSGLKLGDPASQEPLKTGHLYLSLSDAHLTIRRKNTLLYSELSNESLVSGHRPSVDVLFRSAAQAKVKCVAAVLTGMGRDGAAGMKEIYETGLSNTFAQDAKSSVVYGMPKVALTSGGVTRVGNLEQINQWITEACVINTKVQTKKAAA